MIVVDASIAAAFVLPDETSPPEHIVDRLLAGPLHAPQHWPLEVANAIKMAERRRRIDRDTRSRCLADLRDWTVTLDPGTSQAAWGEIIQLSDEHRLTIYDAAYLELALRSGAALTSTDTDLVDAARRCGLEVLTYTP